LEWDGFGGDGGLELGFGFLFLYLISWVFSSFFLVFLLFLFSLFVVCFISIGRETRSYLA
jgi:hypothetical protein